MLRCRFWTLKIMEWKGAETLERGLNKKLSETCELRAKLFYVHRGSIGIKGLEIQLYGIDINFISRQKSSPLINYYTCLIDLLRKRKR